MPQFPHVLNWNKDGSSSSDGHQDDLINETLPCPGPGLERPWVSRAPGSSHRPHPSDTELAPSPSSETETSFPPIHIRVWVDPSGLQRDKQLSELEWGLEYEMEEIGPKSRGSKRPSQAPIWHPVPGVVDKAGDPWHWWLLERVFERFHLLRTQAQRSADLFPKDHCS